MEKPKEQNKLIEYILTYGYAVVVIVIVIGILWWYGIFNPNTWVTKGDTITYSFNCGHGTILTSLDKDGNAEVYVNDKIVETTHDNGTEDTIAVIEVKVSPGSQVIPIRTRCYNKNMSVK